MICSENDSVHSRGVFSGNDNVHNQVVIKGRDSVNSGVVSSGNDNLSTVELCLAIMASINTRVVIRGLELTLNQRIKEPRK